MVRALTDVTSIVNWAMLEELVAVVRKLRSECPWDRKQTVSTTRPLLLNEAYELDEALAAGKVEDIVEELGDYLFMGIFLADVLAKEQGIRLEQIIERVIAKLKKRHPHIYGQAKVTGVAQVLRNWELIKQAEANREGNKRTYLDSLPKTLPALKYAQLIQERCARVGFDWPEPSQVLDKVIEEVNEVREELKRARTASIRKTRSSAAKIGKKRSEKSGGSKGGRAVAEELGDLFFVLVNLCRHLGLDAETVLRDANSKFVRRFRLMEQELSRQGKKTGQASLEEMDAVWNRIKQR